MTRRSAKVSHLQGNLEMPGFKGFPTGGNMESGFATLQELPQPEIASSRIAEKLSNGRRTYGHMPLHEEDVRPRIQALSREFLMYGFKQSAPSSKTKRANCPETAMIPNAKPIPFYHDLADAQKGADDQLQNAHEHFYHDIGKRFPSVTEIVEKHRVLRPKGEHAKVSDKLKPSGMMEKYLEGIKSPEAESMEQFFSDYNKVRIEQQIVDLINKGYSEDEVTEFMRSKRLADIQKDALSPSSFAATEAAIMAMRTPPTHTNAAGLTPQNANQTQAVEMLSLPAKKTQGIRLGGLKTQAEAYAMAGARMAQPEKRVEAIQEVQEELVEPSAGEVSKKGRGRPAGTPQSELARLRIGESQKLKHREKRVAKHSAVLEEVFGKAEEGAVAPHIPLTKQIKESAKAGAKEAAVAGAKEVGKAAVTALGKAAIRAAVLSFI